MRFPCKICGLFQRIEYWLVCNVYRSTTPERLVAFVKSFVSSASFEYKKKIQWIWLLRIQKYLIHISHINVFIVALCIIFISSYWNFKIWNCDTIETFLLSLDQTIQLFYSRCLFYFLSFFTLNESALSLYLYKMLSGCIPIEYFISMQSVISSANTIH